MQTISPASDGLDGPTVRLRAGRLRVGRLRTRIPAQRRPADEPPPAVDRPWRRALVMAAIAYAVSRLILIGATAFSWIGEIRPPVRGVGAALRSWISEYDAGWFIQIAKIGYPADSPGEAHAAFFPLYPALIRLVSPVFGGNFDLAAFAVANAALLGALVVLYRLADHEFGPGTAGRTLLYLLAFPTGFFLTAAYNEGLFIGLMVASVYAMRRGHWWWAGVAGLFAATARSVGILLVLAFAYEYLRRRRIRLDALAVLLIPLGLGAVMLAGQYYYHDSLAFLHAQSRHWGRALTWPWAAIVDAARLLFSNGRYQAPFGEVWVHNVLELGTVLLLITLTVLMLVGPWRVPRDQRLYPWFGLTLIVFMVSFPSTYTAQIPYPLVSTSRIGLEIFPAFVMLGRLGRNRILDRAILALFLPIQGILIARFLHAGWIA